MLQNKQVIPRCDLAIAKWFVDAFIPFNATNSTCFQPMIDALCSMSPGYKAPSMHCLHGDLLISWVDNVHKLADDYRSIWKKIGCTVTADGWTDRKRRTLINFLVYCPKGTIFLKSIDVSHASKSIDLLFKFFKDVVLRVGPKNVVHIVTYNATNYVVAGR